MLYAKLIGRIALFTCENIAHIEFYLHGLLPKILATYTIKLLTALLNCVLVSNAIYKEKLPFHLLRPTQYMLKILPVILFPASACFRQQTHSLRIGMISPWNFTSLTSTPKCAI